MYNNPGQSLIYLINFLITLVDDARVFNDAEFVCEWDFVSVGAVVVDVVPDAFVTWSAGNDSGTVCNVVLIVVDIVIMLFKIWSHL